MDDEFPAITKARSLALKRHRRLGELKQRLNERSPAQSNANNPTSSNTLNYYPDQILEANARLMKNKHAPNCSASVASPCMAPQPLVYSGGVDLLAIAARAEAILADARAKVEDVLGNEIPRKVASCPMDDGIQDAVLIRARALLKQHQDSWVPYEKAVPFGHQHDLALQQKASPPETNERAITSKSHALESPGRGKDDSNSMHGRSNQPLLKQHRSGRSVVSTETSHTSPRHHVYIDASQPHTAAQPVAVSTEASTSPQKHLHNNSAAPSTEGPNAVFTEVCLSSSATRVQSHGNVAHENKNDSTGASVLPQHCTLKQYEALASNMAVEILAPKSPKDESAVPSIHSRAAAMHSPDPELRPGCLILDESFALDNETQARCFDPFNQQPNSREIPTSLDPCHRSTCSEAWSVTTAGSDDIRASHEVRDACVDGSWASSTDKKAAGNTLVIDNPFLVAHMDNLPPRTQDTAIDQGDCDCFNDMESVCGSSEVGASETGADAAPHSAEIDATSADGADVITPTLSNFDDKYLSKEKGSAWERAELGWSVARLSVALPLEAKPPSRLKGLSQRVRQAMDLQARTDQKLQAQGQVETHSTSSLSIDSHKDLRTERAGDIRARFRVATLHRALRRWASLAATRRRRAQWWCSRCATARRGSATVSTALSAWVDHSTVATRAGRYGLAVLYSDRKLQQVVWSKWVVFVTLSFGFMDKLDVSKALPNEEASQGPRIRRDTEDKNCNSESDDEVVLLSAPKG